MNNVLQHSVRRQTAIVFFTSLALMMFEVSLIRLYSVLMYHHLAFFVLSISLFGIGIGGLYAHLVRAYDGRKWQISTWLQILPFLLLISVLLVPVVLIYSPVGAPQSNDQMPDMQWIFVAFLTCALPFVLGSMYISLIFSLNAEKANTLYFSDLLGASAGCLVALISLQIFGGLNGSLVIALLLMLPLVMETWPNNGQRWGRCLIGLAAIILIASLLFLSCGFLRLRGDRYANLLYEKWNYYSFITVQNFPDWRGWRSSHNFNGPYPEHLQIRQDGRAPAFIVAFDGDYEKVEYLKWDITSLPFYIAEPEKALVIGAGGGRDILASKLFGVSHVRGVELNPNIASALRNEFKAYSGGIYTAEGVDIVVENARTFLRGDTEYYDLIFTSLADTQTASNQGAQILSENHLYTTQAYEDYWDRLSEKGMCTIVCGLAEQMVRHVSAAAQALENKGIKEPEKHLIAIMTDAYGPVSRGLFLAFSKEPMTGQMLANAEKASHKLGYKMVWPVVDGNDEWTRTIGLLADPDTRDATVAALPMDYSPLDDDRPYLFYNVKPRTFFSALLRPLAARPDFGEETKVFYVLLKLFFVIGLCVFLLMFTPLVFFNRHELRQAGVSHIQFLLVFLMLGVGYMLVEISLLQHFFLLLGNPTLTFTLVLGMMLSCTGLGSFMAKSFPASSLTKVLVLVSLIAVLIQAGVIATLPSIQQIIQGYSMGIRLFAVFLVILILATPMGFLFPSAIRLVEYKRLNMICWAWGMNGLGSVFGIVGATVLSMNTGIRATFMVGIACYGAVFLLSLLFLLRKAANGQA